jgi:hypothetical protein
MEKERAAILEKEQRRMDEERRKVSSDIAAQQA